MLETAIALAFGHLVADFTLQTDWMVRRKREPLVLLAHVGVVLLVTWIALGFAIAPLVLLFIGAAHLATDWAKLRWGGAGFTGFAVDQAAHAAAILLAAALFPGAFDAGLWGNPPAALAPLVARIPAAMTLAGGLIAAVWAGGYAVQALMQGVKLPADPQTLPKGGQLIGRLERLMILMLVLAGEPGGIGFLIAAKSILRFNELARDEDLRVSEYVIIGTLASFAWGLAAAFVTSAILAGLGHP
jgi:hypothetical protein